MEQTSQVTIVTFIVYIVEILLLAAIAHRFLSGKSFLAKYFLGSRGLGSWALAFTFAATSASGGSFTGFPSLIYSYGWLLAFWVASYMVVPLCTMGVMGKRLNQVARKTGAITVPDVLRDRYDSGAIGLFAVCTIVFYTVSNLVAQFKAGALIVEATFNLSETWGYLAGLGIFAGVVVIYTAYGGFRAVVWTDVVQGVFMGIGVVILLPIVLSLAGGGRQVFENIRTQPPSLVTSLPGEHNDLVFLLRHNGQQELPVGVEYQVGTEENPSVALVRNSTGERVIRVLLPLSLQPPVSAREIKDAVEHDSLAAPILLGVEYAYENDGSGAVAPMVLRRFTRGQDFLFGPGREPDGTPFHPFGMTLSFFLIWAIAGMGQPGTMVRLMAFRDSRTLKRAILIVTVYYGLIYLPLVWIFVTARTLLSYLPQESSDKAMVLGGHPFGSRYGMGLRDPGGRFRGGTLRRHHVYGGQFPVDDQFEPGPGHLPEKHQSSGQPASGARGQLRYHRAGRCIGHRAGHSAHRFPAVHRRLYGSRFCQFLLIPDTAGALLEGHDPAGGDQLDGGRLSGSRLPVCAQPVRRRQNQPLRVAPHRVGSDQLSLLGRVRQ